MNVSERLAKLIEQEQQKKAQEYSTNQANISKKIQEAANKAYLDKYMAQGTYDKDKLKIQNQLGNISKTLSPIAGSAIPNNTVQTIRPMEMQKLYNYSQSPLGKLDPTGKMDHSISELLNTTSKNANVQTLLREAGQVPKENQDELLKAAENWKDGWQAGDVLKTVGSTLAEIPTRLTTGALSVSEGMAQLGSSLIAGGADLLGQDIQALAKAGLLNDKLQAFGEKSSKFGNALRQQIATTNPLTAGLRNINEKLNANSVTGGLFDSAVEGVGQTLGQMAITGLISTAPGLKATNASIPIKLKNFQMEMPITALVTGAGSAAQNTYAKTYEQLGSFDKATFKDKLQMAFNIALGGTIEGFTEGIFGLTTPAGGKFGGSSLEEVIQKQVMAKMTTATDKMVAGILLAGGGEAAEECISYVLNWLLGKGVIDRTGRLQLNDSFKAEDMFQEALSAFISSVFTQGYSNITQVNHLTARAVTEAQLEQKRILTDAEQKEIRNKMIELVNDATQETLQLAEQKNLDATSTQNLRNKYNINTMANAQPNLQQLRSKYNLPSMNNENISQQNNIQEESEIFEPSETYTVDNNEQETKNSIAEPTIKYNADGSFDRVKINDDIFEGNEGKTIAQTIKEYLTEHIGEYADIIESGQRVYLGEDLPNEYSYSEYTKNLPVSKKIAKGRATNGIKEIINNVTNRRYEANRKEKHKIDAKYGFYKYDTKFSFEHNGKEQTYTGTVLIRNDVDGKKYLYDILNIKKERNLPLVASNSQKSSAIISGSNSSLNKSIQQKNENVNQLKETESEYNITDIDSQINDDLKYNNIIEEDMTIDDEKIDEYVAELVQKYYKPSEEAQNDEDIEYDEMIDFSDDVREKVESALEERGYTRYDGGYNASDSLYQKFEEITDYLDSNDIDYETSKSIYSGDFPSIYVKDSEGNTVMRIGNHDNSQGAKQTYTNREILEDTQKIYDDIQKVVGDNRISEPQSEYENQLKLNMDVATTVEASSKNYNGGLKPIVKTNKVWEGYKKTGYIDLTNTKVSTVQDMAEVAQIFRNPYYETFRVIYTKNGVIAGTEAVTSFLPGQVNLVTKKDKFGKTIYKMSDRMNRLGADGYYLIHNHPSGKATVSAEDIRATQSIANQLQGFKGHVVVDHGTYAMISENMQAENNIKLQVDNTYAPGQLTNGYENMNITNRGQLANLANNLRHDENFSSLILTDSSAKVNAIIDIPNAMFNNKQIEGYINNVMKQYGAVNAFIATQSQNVYDTKLSNVKDSILYQTTMNTVSEAEKAERAERVHKYIEEMQKSLGTLGAEVDRKEIVNRIVESYGIEKVGNNKVLNDVAKEMQRLIKAGALTDAKIEGYAEKLLDDLKMTFDEYYKANKELKEVIQKTKLYVSPEIKKGFAHWNDFRLTNTGILKLTNDTSALPVDTFYQELSAQYGEDFFPSDIANASDQLEQLSEVARNIKKIDQTLRDNFMENFGDEAVEEIKNGLIQNLKTMREKLSTESKENEPISTEIKDRSWSKTVNNNDMISQFLDIKTMQYVTQPNRETLNVANNILNTKGFKGALGYFKAIVDSGKLPKPNDIALGERLIQEAIKKGDFEQATDLITDVAILGTELGQSVQALSMISRLSPAGQLMYLRKTVERIENQKASKTPQNKKKQKLRGMLNQIVEGEQAKNELSKIATDDINDVIGKIVSGEQLKMKLPQKIRDNTKLMDLVDKVVTGEQIKIKLNNELKKDTQLKKIADKIVEGEQTKLDLGSLDGALEALKQLNKTDLMITPEMEIAILSAQNSEELETVMERIKQELADKLPTTYAEKLTAWRYLAMLGNPKTHVRNTLGNLIMKAPYEIKNEVQRILETAFDEKLEERTKTFEKATQEVKEFAEQMLEAQKEALSGNGYSKLEDEIKSLRKTFKNNALQKVYETNSKALDFEDFYFKRQVFKQALAEYLTANKIKTKVDINANTELVQKAINYAVEEAKKATFNQFNKVATAISHFENTSEVGKILVGGIAPFKRTPLNIVKTSWQYSPMGLAETLTLRLRDLKNGIISGNEFIERISQGVTGLGITVLGFLLASLGTITGSSSGSKKDKYEESIGIRKPYSIKIGNYSFDIAWLSPSAVPFLIGAELHALSQNGESNATVGDIIEVIEKSMNPISDMTMLSTFNDALTNYGSSDNSLDAIGALVDTVVKSYIGQFFPTLGNMINKIIDPTIRSTQASKNSKWKSAEQVIRQNINKIPGASYILEPSLDVWGNERKRSDNMILRAFDSLFNPAQVTKNISSQVDEEILKIYHKNENNNILPKTPNNYFTASGTKYEFSASEYTTFKITYGQTSFQELSKLFKTSQYKEMTTQEKEKAIEKVYDNALEKAKLEYLTKKMGKTKGYKAMMTDLEYKRYEKAQDLMSISEFYKVYQAQKQVIGDKDDNGKTITGSEKKNRIAKIQEMMPELNLSEVQQLYKYMNNTL